MVSQDDVSLRHPLGFRERKGPIGGHEMTSDGGKKRDTKIGNGKREERPREERTGALERVKTDGQG